MNRPEEDDRCRKIGDPESALRRLIALLADQIAAQLRRQSRSADSGGKDE